MPGFENILWRREIYSPLIQALITSIPSRWLIVRPSSGIITPGSFDSIRYKRIDSSGFPFVISYFLPPEPRPAATGVLLIPRSVESALWMLRFKPEVFAGPSGL